jgi:protein TonB
MTAATMFDHHERADVYRWTTSALIVTALHGLVFVGWNSWPDSSPPAGGSLPPVVIELSLVSATPQTTPLDLAPGPVMQQSDSSAAASKPEASAEQAFAPVLPVAESDVVLPAAQPHVTQSEEVKKEPHKGEAKEVTPAKKTDDRKKTSVERKPAPKTTAPPRAEHRAQHVASSHSGMEAMASVLPSYRERVAAHLQRYKQYPAELRAAGIRGTSRLTFTVNRSGRVLASRLSGSSGNAGLDAETMAMIRRAQPLPPFPPEITVSSMSFTVPVLFSVR